MKKSITKLHLLISGRVQGVSFRINTKRKADTLGIKGWVKNSPEGTVEAKIIGEKSNIDKMLAWLKKGPFFAKVNNVEILSKKTIKKTPCASFEVKR